MLEDTHEGKSVVTKDGETIGTIIRIQDGTAYIRPIPGLLAGRGSRISRGLKPDSFPLSEQAIDSIDQDSITLSEPSNAHRVPFK